MAELDEYRGPNVAVDIAVLTRTDAGLAVLIQQRTTRPRGAVLPGRFLREGETVGEGLRIALSEKAGIEVGPVNAAMDFVVAKSDSIRSISAHSVGVFDKPGRDRRSSWSLSLAYYVVLPLEHLTDSLGEFVPIELDGSVEPALLFDHDSIVREAARHLRARYESTADPGNLLVDSEITLPDLQDVHEAILGERLRVDTFRRRMETWLDEVIDPIDPKAKRQKTRPSGPNGGPPTRLWTKRLLATGVPTDANRLWRLPRAAN